MNIKIQFIRDNKIVEKKNIKYFSLDNKTLTGKILEEDDTVPICFMLCDIVGLKIENDKKEETPEDPADALPWSMNQYRTVVDAIIKLASVSGDLTILEKNPKLEMSKELREQLEELVYELKRFDESFMFEF